MVKIKYKLCPDGYKHAGLPFPKQADRRRKHAVVSITTAMADTGCSTMVAGLDFVYALGITKRDLVPAETEVKAVIKTKIDIFVQ